MLAFAGPFYPDLVQRYTVQPNELAVERPYIEHNIRATRYAYGLDGVAESDYAVTEGLSAETLEAHADTIDNVRLWDWRPLRRQAWAIRRLTALRLLAISGMVNRFFD